LIALALLSGLTASAGAAGPAAIQVRVEGRSDTVVGLTSVTTTTGSVVKDANPQHSCTGTSAAGGLELATRGNWGGSWYSGLGYSVDAIGPPGGAPVGRETHTFSTDGYYWQFWYDHHTASAGICGQELNAGDDILFFPVCGSGCPSGYSNPAVLGLAAPETASAGHPFAVTVTSYSDTGGYDAQGHPSPDGAPSPGVGATVTVTPGGATFTADSHGQAMVTVPSPSNVSLKATAPSSVRSESRSVCVHDGNDGTCGTSSPPPPGPPADTPTPPVKPKPPTPPPPATHPAPVAPVGRLSGLESHYFRRHHGPRRLLGSVVADASGAAGVDLRVERRFHGRCQAYDGRRERLRPIRCGAAHAPWFSLPGSSSTFSYLLPFPLPSGRYVMDVRAVGRNGRRDSALARGRNRVVFYVG